MNKLEDIGFYTLSDHRAEQSSDKSPLWRCELVLTDACNFKCPYCRGVRKEISGTMPFETAMSTVRLWCKQGLKNVRFSGGEPTLYNGLEHLVAYCRERRVARIAISTNGSADFEVYQNLAKIGVNDFSISLDACCSSVGDKMAGGICGAFSKTVENIKRISKISYTTVGIVINEENLDQCVDTVMFADSLGVSDIRIIPSAQFNRLLDKLKEIPKSIVNKYPILKYRVENSINGRNVRGIKAEDSHKCWLALDDMAVAGGFHFPCIIYMREHGNPIGGISENIRKERADFVGYHDTHLDPICQKSCLDVCVAFNNKASQCRS